jgi:hypothetical protein
VVRRFFVVTRNAKRIDHERLAQKGLTRHKTAGCEEINVDVTTSSAFVLRKVLQYPSVSEHEGVDLLPVHTQCFDCARSGRQEIARRFVGFVRHPHHR